jgi:hypothetical protein
VRLPAILLTILLAALSAPARTAPQPPSGQNSAIQPNAQDQAQTAKQTPAATAQFAKDGKQTPENGAGSGASQKSGAKPVSASSSPAKPVPAAKPRPKPHVYTNDDFDSLPSTASFTKGPELLDQVNECDRDCFEQVGREAGATGRAPATWKQALLDAVERVKGDVPWQELLRNMIDIQAQTCELEGEKAQDMREHADPNNVTPNELAIDRDYEPKFDQVRRRLNAAAARAEAHIATASITGVQAAFMRLQTQRIVHATCNIRVSDPPAPNSDPSAGDDPDDQ